MFAITRITNFNILSIILCSWVVHSEVHKTDVTQLPAGTKKVILKIPDGPYFARENMIITCEFKYFVNFDKRNIRITINGTALSNTTEDINENNFLNIIVTIEIQSLLESHTGLYKCAYYSTNDFLEAEKDIKVWPELQKPKCQASPSYYTEGENVTLTCTATVIYPSLELIWNTGDISLTNPHIITIASKDIHLSKYTCHMIVSLHEWSSVPLFCNVNITRLLKVTINISNVILGQRTTLKCIVHDAHQNLNYTWTYQEINNYFKCDNTNCSNGTNFLINRDITNSLTIQNVTEDMDNSKITCEVKGLNVIGNHTIILQVNRLHETNATTHEISRLHETEATTHGISTTITNKISTTTMSTFKPVDNNKEEESGKRKMEFIEIIALTFGCLLFIIFVFFFIAICIQHIKKCSNQGMQVGTIQALVSYDNESCKAIPLLLTTPSTSVTQLHHHRSQQLFSNNHMGSTMSVISLPDERKRQRMQEPWTSQRYLPPINSVPSLDSSFDDEYTRKDIDDFLNDPLYDEINDLKRRTLQNQKEDFRTEADQDGNVSSWKAGKNRYANQPDVDASGYVIDEEAPYEEISNKRDQTPGNSSLIKEGENALDGTAPNTYEKISDLEESYDSDMDGRIGEYCSDLSNQNFNLYSDVHDQHRNKRDIAVDFDAKEAQPYDTEKTTMSATPLYLDGEDQFNSNEMKESIYAKVKKRKKNVKVKNLEIYAETIEQFTSEESETDEFEDFNRPSEKE